MAENSCAHMNMEVACKLTSNNHEDLLYICGYTLPIESDRQTVSADAKQPVLLSAYPEHQCVPPLLDSLLDHFLREGWDHIDTGNWTKVAVYPLPHSTVTSWNTALPLPARVRKLSQAQQARVTESYLPRVPTDLSILQVQFPDPEGYWPGDPDYMPHAEAMEGLLAHAMGDLT